MDTGNKFIFVESYDLIGGNQFAIGQSGSANYSHLKMHFNGHCCQIAWHVVLTPTSDPSQEILY